MITTVDDTAIAASYDYFWDPIYNSGYEYRYVLPLWCRHEVVMPNYLLKKKFYKSIPTPSKIVRRTMFSKSGYMPKRIRRIRKAK